MGSEIGEFSEQTFLYEAACAEDPVMRLTGVNRALEGLAIDVFNTMKEFGDLPGCEIPVWRLGCCSAVGGEQPGQQARLQRLELTDRIAHLARWDAVGQQLQLISP